VASCTDSGERLKAALKAHPRLVRHVRRLGRFRFGLKARRVREEGVRLRDDPVSVARFVLLDPETHSYSFDLANQGELVSLLEELLEVPRRELEGYLDEALREPELREHLRRRVRWRIDYKRRMPLGNRLLWYALVRAVKPRLTVETGIHDGLGSLMLLVALERNAEEGVEGRLVSIDLDPDSGWLVPSGLRRRWSPVFGDIETTLEQTLEGEELDLLIHDSDHNERLQRIEFGAALAHASPDLFVIDSSGLMLPVLRELCQAHGGEHRYFLERPRSHFYRPPGTSIARFRQSSGQG
jgi:predicted O-methyltransferase YrrM